MLIDHELLLRTLQLRHPQLQVVRSAIKLLAAQGRDLHIVPQNLVELWVVATRPTDQNGLGMAPAATAVELRPIWLFALPRYRGRESGRCCQRREVAVNP